MDTNKLRNIKIVIVAVVAILAIVYYFYNKSSNSNDYENILTNDIVVSNNTVVENTEEKSLIKVYVTGEVNIPGVIELEEGARIEDAINGAGGITEQANLKNINLAYEITDGEKIYIPNVSEQNTEENESVTGSNSENISSNSSDKININKATASELTAIPGIGDSTAQKIISYREENGKFKTIEDIKNVSGIGDSKFNSMKDYISVK